MLKKSLLAATCLVTMTSMVSAASMTPGSHAAPGQQLAAADAATKVTRQSPDMIRASEFIGETVRNGKGDEIGSMP